METPLCTALPRLHVEGWRTSPFLFLWHFLLSQAGRQFMSLYVVRKSWDTDEFYNRNNNRRHSFLTKLLQRSDDSSWNSFLSCKGKAAPVQALPKTFQCLPQDLGMKSRVCAQLKGCWVHLCKYNLFLNHLHSRLHRLNPSQARDTMGLCSSQSLSLHPSLLLHSPLCGQELLLHVPSFSILCFPKATFHNSTTHICYCRCRKLSCIHRWPLSIRRQ